MALNKAPKNPSREKSRTSASKTKLALMGANERPINQSKDLKEQTEEQPDEILKRAPMNLPQELRKATRYQFNSAAVIRWLGPDNHIHQAFGIVRNISVSGVYVETTATISIHTNVELEIAAPSLQAGSSRPELNFEGRVIRSAQQERRYGVAIAGSLYFSERTSRGTCN